MTPARVAKAALVQNTVEGAQPATRRPLPLTTESLGTHFRLAGRPSFPDHVRRVIFPAAIHGKLVAC